LLTGPRSDPVNVKAGAGDPTAGSSPTVLIGFPRIVICAMRTVCQGREGSRGSGLVSAVRGGVCGYWVAGGTSVAISLVSNGPMSKHWSGGWNTARDWLGVSGRQPDSAATPARHHAVSYIVVLCRR
jgi:hypothetical protein